jgi:hypothetical protein
LVFGIDVSSLGVSVWEGRAVIDVYGTVLASPVAPVGIVERCTRTGLEDRFLVVVEVSIRTAVNHRLHLFTFHKLLVVMLLRWSFLNSLFGRRPSIYLRSIFLFFLLFLLRS